MSPLRNLLGQSFGSPADPSAPFFLCDCGASYLASAFALEWAAMACMLIALVAGVLWARGVKPILILICLWTGLIGYGFVRQLTGTVRKLAASSDPAYAGPLIEEYSLRFLASVPAQLIVDALVLFVVPAGLAFVMTRGPLPRSARSTPSE